MPRFSRTTVPISTAKSSNGRAGSCSERGQGRIGPLNGFQIGGHNRVLGQVQFLEARGVVVPLPFLIGWRAMWQSIMVSVSTSGHPSSG